MKKDKYYMRKALELARKGEGYTGNNPLVGAVVVKDDKIVGQGYHKYYGGPHAEVYALEEAGDEARGADLYVNLEPCCHHGKTGPCSLKVINSGIRRLIVGMQDPNSRVDGKGLKMIKEQGIEVKTGVLKDECRKLNEIFIKYITGNLPFVILKAAQTVDGFLATRSGDSQWITNKKARQYGHRLRHKTAAVLVGIGTVLSDNPRLTTRLEENEGQDGIRVVLDPSLKIPAEARIINHNSETETLLVCGPEVSEEKSKMIGAKEKVDIMQLELNDRGQIPLRKLLQELHKREISSVLVEGGGHVNYSFLKEGLIDKVYMFTAPRIYGGADGVSTFSGSGPDKMEEVSAIQDLEIIKLDDNVLFKGYLQN